VSLVSDTIEVVAVFVVLSGIFVLQAVTNAADRKLYKRMFLTCISFSYSGTNLVNNNEIT
jgi:hypothetical protein